MTKIQIEKTTKIKETTNGNWNKKVFTKQTNNTSIRMNETKDYATYSKTTTRAEIKNKIKWTDQKQDNTTTQSKYPKGLVNEY